MLHNIATGAAWTIICIFGPAIVGLLFAEDKGNLGECWAMGFLTLGGLAAALLFFYVLGYIINGH